MISRRGSNAEADVSLLDWLPDEIYLKILSLLSMSDVVGAVVVDWRFANLFYDKTLIQARCKKHFPQEYLNLSERDKVEDVDWYSWFNQLSNTAYSDSIEPEVVKQFIAVREQRAMSLLGDDRPTMLTLSANIEDGLGYRLIPLAYSFGEQHFLDACYVEVARFYENHENDLHLIVDDIQWTLLCWAVWLNQGMVIIDALINLGSNINGFSNVCSPLALAAISGNLSLVEVLLNRGANIECGFKKRSPLSLAAEAGHAEVCRVLLDAGANVNAVDVYRVSPLQYAVKKGHLGVVQVFFNFHADRNDVDCEHWAKPALEVAIKEGQIHVVRYIVSAENMSSWLKVDSAKLQLTFYAATQDQPNILALLVRAGAPLPYSRVVDGLSCRRFYQYIVEKNMTHIIKQYLRDSATFKAMIASAFDDRDVDEFISLVQSPPKFHSMYLHTIYQAISRQPVISNTHWQMIRYSMENLGLSANYSDELRQSLLARVVRSGYPYQVIELLGYGANPNAADVYCVTPLHLAARLKDSGRIAQTLINYGASLELVDNKGMTPLMVALKYKRTIMAVSMLQHVCHVNATDKHHITTLMYGALTASPGIVEALLYRQANLSSVAELTKSELCSLISNDYCVLSPQEQELYDAFVANKAEPLRVTAVDLAILKGYTEVVGVIRKFEHEAEVLLNKADMRDIQGQFNEGFVRIPNSSPPRRAWRHGCIFRRQHQQLGSVEDFSSQKVAPLRVGGGHDRD